MRRPRPKFKVSFYLYFCCFWINVTQINFENIKRNIQRIISDSCFQLKSWFKVDARAPSIPLLNFPKQFLPLDDENQCLYLCCTNCTEQTNEQTNIQTYKHQPFVHHFDLQGTIASNTSQIGAFTLLTSRFLKSQHFDPTIYTCAKTREVSWNWNFASSWLVVHMCDHRLQCMQRMQYAWGPRISIHVSKSARS